MNENILNGPEKTRHGIRDLGVSFQMSIKKGFHKLTLIIENHYGKVGNDS